MRRTTSLLEISPSLWATTQSPSRPTWLDETFSEAIPMVPERKNVIRRHSNDLSLVNASHFFDAAHFLNVCGLCKRSIGPGTDTFMYSRRSSSPPPPSSLSSRCRAPSTVPFLSSHQTHLLPFPSNRRQPSPSLTNHPHPPQNFPKHPLFFPRLRGDPLLSMSFICFFAHGKLRSAAKNAEISGLQKIGERRSVPCHL